MASKERPSKEEIREELRKHGIHNLDDLVQEAARRAGQGGDPASERYMLVGSGYVLIIPGTFVEP